YKYARLKSSDSIRVLKIEPSLDRNTPLLFSFEIGHLADLRDRYEALSYTWGEPVFSHHIFSVEDGTSIPITGNLDMILRRFREPSRVRSLWIDAVCIDQQDDNDKANQIGMMKAIYSTASRVLVWLGGGSVVEDALRKLCAASRNPPSTRIEGIEKHLQTILTRPYFTRRWIIQELVSNLDVTLFCEEFEMTWIRLMAAVQNCEEYLTSSSQNLEGLKSAQTLIELWRMQAQGDSTFSEQVFHDAYPEQELTILELLGRFGAYQYSNPHDNLYALH
ncbi:heterokaryon incompatibility protein-domain-containing protein, partial [Lophiotrema nucula]